MRAANRAPPERIGPGDLALMTVATHKAARLLAKGRVTAPPASRSPASRVPSGPTRWIAVLTAHFESDVLHIACKKAENSM